MNIARIIGAGPLMVIDTEVLGALARVEDGTYGTCTDCGGDIGFERLLAYPTAKRCVSCQRQHEKTYVHEGNPTL